MNFTKEPLENSVGGQWTRFAVSMTSAPIIIRQPKLLQKKLSLIIARRKKTESAKSCNNRIVGVRGFLKYANSRGFVNIPLPRLRAHKRRKNGILHRRLPPLTERAAQADVPLEHPRRAAAGQLVDAGIGLGQRPEQCLRVGRGRRLGLFLRGRVGQDVRQGLGPELRRGVLGLRRGGGRLFCLRLLRLLRQGEDHDRGQPRRGEHAARDQAVACDGKAEQDQKKADDDAFDGTHGGSSFRCAAAGTSRGSRAAPRRACRRRVRRYSRGPDKNAGR